MGSRPAWFTSASSRTARAVIRRNPVLKKQRKSEREREREREMKEGRKRMKEKERSAQKS